MNDREGARRNEQIAHAGEQEMDTGRFSEETKQREGRQGTTGERRI
jgi:hypothetical protein